MTPTQQSALEALAGRSLTADEIALGDARSDATLAASLSTGLTKLVPTEVGIGTVLAVCGITAGNALLDYLKGAADFRHVWPLLEQGRLRMDSALVRGTLDSLVTANLLPAALAAALKAQAEQPDYIAVGAVSDILNGA